MGMTDNKHHSYHILINKYSGGFEPLGEDFFVEVFDESNIDVASLEFLEPDALLERLDAIKDGEHPILIGGGDGTIRGCAEIMMNAKQSFGVLPLGTMNLMARDLNIPLDIKDAVAAYAHDMDILDIDVGMVNGETFLCCVGIGTMPESSEFREDNRNQNAALLMPRLTVFVLDQIDQVKHRYLRLTMDGVQKSLKTAALVISNNHYQPQEQWSDNNFMRESLSHGQLGVYSAAPKTIWDRIRIITRLGFGDWRKDPFVAEWKAETVTVRTKRAEELVSLDGETMTLETPLNFWINRRALNVLVPAVAEGEGEPSAQEVAA